MSSVFISAANFMKFAVVWMTCAPKGRTGQMREWYPPTMRSFLTRLHPSEPRLGILLDARQISSSWSTQLSSASLQAIRRFERASCWQQLLSCAGLLSNPRNSDQTRASTGTTSQPTVHLLELYHSSTAAIGRNFCAHSGICASDLPSASVPNVGSHEYNNSGSSQKKPPPCSSSTDWAKTWQREGLGRFRQGVCPSTDQICRLHGNP